MDEYNIFGGNRLIYFNFLNKILYCMIKLNNMFFNDYVLFLIYKE